MWRPRTKAEVFGHDAISCSIEAGARSPGGATPSRRRLREGVQVGGGVLVQPQRAGERVDHLRGGVVVAALFEPKVIVRADAGEQRQLITAQPWNTAAAEAAQPDVFGAQQLASGTEVLTERRAHHHGAPRYAARSRPACP
jgi:hypothetical protein